jgi:hypothetical protein
MRSSVIRSKARQRRTRQFGMNDEFGFGQTINRLHPAKGSFKRQTLL